MEESWLLGPNTAKQTLSQEKSGLATRDYLNFGYEFWRSSNFNEFFDLFICAKFLLIMVKMQALQQIEDPQKYKLVNISRDCYSQN